MASSLLRRKQSIQSAILQARIRDGLLDDAPIWDDARTFDGRPWAGSVDIVTAGFPCQPFSQAGKGLADRDERNLWPDTIRIVREVRPQWVLLENVSRLLSHAYIRRIFGDLAESGYDTRWDCIPASAIGANHQRDRLWIIATHADSAGLRLQSGRRCRPGRKDPSQLANDGEAQSMAHANRQGLEGGGIPRPIAERGEEVADSTIGSGLGGSAWWQVEPRLGRVADGVANQVERIAAIGDGQVPAVVKVVWELLSKEMR